MKANALLEGVVPDPYGMGVVQSVAGRESYNESEAMVLPVALPMAPIISFRQAWGLFVYMIFPMDGGKAPKVFAKED